MKAVPSSAFAYAMAARMSLLLLVVVSAALSAAARKEGPGSLAAGVDRTELGSGARRSLLQNPTPVPTVQTQVPQTVGTIPGGTQQTPAVLIPTVTSQQPLQQLPVQQFPTQQFIPGQPLQTIPGQQFPPLTGQIPTFPGQQVGVPNQQIYSLTCPPGYTLALGSLGEECILTSLLSTQQALPLGK